MPRANFAISNHVSGNMAKPLGISDRNRPEPLVERAESTRKRTEGITSRSLFFPQTILRCLILPLQKRRQIPGYFRERSPRVAAGPGQKQRKGSDEANPTRCLFPAASLPFPLSPLQKMQHDPMSLAEKTKPRRREAANGGSQTPDNANTKIEGKSGPWGEPKQRERAV